MLLWVYVSNFLTFLIAVIRKKVDAPRRLRNFADSLTMLSPVRRRKPGDPCVAVRFRCDSREPEKYDVRE